MTDEQMLKQMEKTINDNAEYIANLEKQNNELQEELNYAETHCLFHGDCPIQEENVVAKEQVEKMKNCLRELIESMQPIKFEEDRQRAIAKAEAFLKE